MSTTMIDIAGYCGNATDDAALAICAVNADLQDTKKGLNTFFLIFAVSWRVVLAVQRRYLVTI